MSSSHFDLVIIGGGPGGYIAAIRAAQLGKSVACVEMESALGGVCLRIGCIPSKALLESSHLYEAAKHQFAGRGIVVPEVGIDLPKMMEHKAGVVKALTGGIDGIFKKRKITRLKGRARLDGPGRVTIEGKDAQSITAEFIILATGSSPATLPGIELDGDRVVSSTEALSFSEVPKSLIAIGAGYIGLEMGTVWRRLGSDVTVLEYLDRILPGMDSVVATDALKIFKKQGLKFQLGCKVTGVTKSKDGVEVQIDGAPSVKGDRVLVSVGRKPNSQNLGLESVGVQTDKRGFITVDPNFKTTAPGVYAVGDVIGGAMLAHKAEEEGVACVEYIFKGHGHVNYDVIPGVVYTEPEVATVGQSEDQLKQKGIPYKKGQFPFIANARARASGQMDGYVKILAHQETDRILGVHIIGLHAGELIAEAAAAIEFGASSEDLARTCHAHPTLAEVTKEAALAVDGRALNI